MEQIIRVANRKIAEIKASNFRRYYKNKEVIVDIEPATDESGGYWVSVKKESQERKKEINKNTYNMYATKQMKDGKGGTTRIKKVQIEAFHKALGIIVEE